MTAPEALLVDWGGVITIPFSVALREWARAEGLDPDHVIAVISDVVNDPSGNPLHRLEVGAGSREESAPWLADRLASGGIRPDHDGLFERMFAPLRVRQEALAFVAELRAMGVCTVLVSNSWGDSYDRTGWADAFTHTVVSGEVGLRKPTAEMFDFACRLAGVSPSDAVFVDDEPEYIVAAEAFGLRAVHMPADDPVGLPRLRALWTPGVGAV